MHVVMSGIATIGFDLAKNALQTHGAGASGLTALRKRLRREPVRAFFGHMQPCLLTATCELVSARTVTLSILRRGDRAIRRRHVRTCSWCRWRRTAPDCIGLKPGRGRRRTSADFACARTAAWFALVAGAAVRNSLCIWRPIAPFPGRGSGKGPSGPMSCTSSSLGAAFQ